MSKNFKIKEAACKDGTPYPKKWRPQLEYCFELLEIIRAITGMTMTLNSAYRTPEYNKKVGGAEKSQHLNGLAFDFVLKGITPAKLFPILDRFQRLGVLPKGGLHAYKTFTHIDMRGKIARW